jgi:hypothetical protein
MWDHGDAAFAVHLVGDWSGWSPLGPLDRDVDNLEELDRAYGRPADWTAKGVVATGVSLKVDTEGSRP